MSASLLGSPHRRRRFLSTLVLHHGGFVSTCATVEVPTFGEADTRETPLPTDRPFRRPLALFLRRLARLPLLVLATVYFLLDEVVPALLRPVYARLAELRLFERLGAAILALSPVATLILFLVPFVVLEPFKILALVLLAGGHFTSGAVMLAASHLASIVLVERLFRLTKPKLLTIGWFARIHGIVERIYDWSLGRLKATAAWRSATALLRRVRETLRGVKALLLPPIAAALRGIAERLRRRPTR
jgi:hypothetical protein